MDVLKYPLATEKAIKMIEANNIIAFIVDSRATANLIKNELESKFKVKIDNIRIMIDTKGRKKAYIKLNNESPAIDIATKLGIM